MPAAKAKTRWGDRAQRRQDLLAAARRLLAQRGYAGLNVRDVARGAGVSAALVYSYFNDREELFAALYTERLERFHEEIAPLCARARTTEELFAGVAERYLEVYRLFGRELGLWSGLVGGQRYSTEVAGPLAAAATRVLVTVMESAERCAGAGGFSLLALPERELVAPLLWATLTGLADHFTSQRHRVHGHGWDQLVGFAARVLTTGLRQLAPSSTPPASSDSTATPAGKGGSRRRAATARRRGA